MAEDTALCTASQRSGGVWTLLLKCLCAQLPFGGNMGENATQASIPRPPEMGQLVQFQKVPERNSLQEVLPRNHVRTQLQTVD